MPLKGCSCQRPCSLVVCGGAPGNIWRSGLNPTCCQEHRRNHSLLAGGSLGSRLLAQRRGLSPCWRLSLLKASRSTPVSVSLLAALFPPGEQVSARGFMPDSPRRNNVAFCIHLCILLRYCARYCHKLLCTLLCYCASYCDTVHTIEIKLLCILLCYCAYSCYVAHASKNADAQRKIMDRWRVKKRSRPTLHFHVRRAQKLTPPAHTIGTPFIFRTD